MNIFRLLLPGLKTETDPGCKPTFWKPFSTLRSCCRQHPDTACLFSRVSTSRGSCCTVGPTTTTLGPSSLHLALLGNYSLFLGMYWGALCEYPLVKYVPANSNHVFAKTQQVFFLKKYFSRGWIGIEMHIGCLQKVSEWWGILLQRMHDYFRLCIPEKRERDNPALKSRKGVWKRKLQC